jgi:hypothetical protein
MNKDPPSDTVCATSLRVFPATACPYGKGCGQEGPATGYRGSLSDIPRDRDAIHQYVSRITIDFQE